MRGMCVCVRVRVWEGGVIAQQPVCFFALHVWEKVKQPGGYFIKQVYQSSDNKSD